MRKAKEEDCGLDWAVFEEDNGETHVIPLNDTKEHDHCIHCACSPFIDEEENEIIHNSYDGREAFEEGFRRVS